MQAPPQHPNLVSVTRSSSVNVWLSGALGFSTFLPIGTAYLFTLLLTLGVLVTRNQWSDRKDALHWLGLGGVLCLFLAWPLLRVVWGDWHPSTPSRLFHLIRVAWVIALGLVLTNRERQAALWGLMGGALTGAAVVIAHHLWGLPEWSVWNAYLAVLGNNSSQKMIMMAMVAGLAFWLGLRPEVSYTLRIFYWILFALLATVVSFHAISRNAHLVLITLPMVALAYRWRHWRQLLPATGLVLVVVALLWQYTPFIKPRFETAVAELHALTQDANYNSSIGARGRMSLEAWRAFRNAPLQGTGIGSWETIWRDAAIEYPDLAGYNNPHNDYALFAMESGLPGLLLMVALPLTLGWTNWRRQSTYGGMGMLAVATVLISTAVNAPWRDATLGMAMIWLMAALTDTPNRRSQETI